MRSERAASSEQRAGLTPARQSLFAASEGAWGERWDAVAALALATGVFVAWTFERLFPGATALDRSLPLIAIALAVVTWMVRGTRWLVALECAVPLLIGASMAISDPQVRAAAFGVIVAVTFCAALIAAGRMPTASAMAFLVSGIALIRWIARERYDFTREALLLIACILIVLAFRKRSWGVAVALVAALFTPAIPSRTIAFPLLIAIVARIGSAIAGRKRFEVPLLTAAADAAAILAVAATLLVFPWSGVAGRALPWFWRSSVAVGGIGGEPVDGMHTPSIERVPLHYALVPGEKVPIDLPRGSRALIVSAANGLAMKPGTVLGVVESPELKFIRMGEVADWGYARREQFWRSKNVLPLDPAGTIHGWGYDSWIDGAGRIALPVRARRVVVTAAPSMPSNARLQVESIEVQRQ